MSITINHLTFGYRNAEPLLHDIDLHVSYGEKVALVGDNGTGKSTLLQLAAGLLHPLAGEVRTEGTPYVVPQHFGQYDAVTVAGALGIDRRLDALHAILGGALAEPHYADLGDDWEVESRARAALDTWGLGHVGFDRPMAELSGGEKTRVFLSGIAVHDPAVILLDEPSNHLDSAAREQLYALIRASRSAMLVVSHDRALLDLIDTTCELERGGITRYGGNYAFYREQRAIRMAALEARIGEREKKLRAAHRTVREVAERKQRQDARGSGKAVREGLPRIMMNTVRNRAEASGARLGEVHEARIGALAGELRQARGELPAGRDLKVRLDDTVLHRGKVLVEARGMNFAYGDHPLWPEPLSLLVRSGDRVAVSGPNGSGKTTLLRLVGGGLEPSSGILERAPFTTLYVDQEYSLIDGRLTVLGQAERFNARHLPGHELKTELHRCLFPAGVWDRPCAALSGGEKMRLLFCCLVIGDAAPDVFILDEPTNNLDLRSLGVITSALRAYRGTVVVVSHDRRFVDEIGADREIALSART